MVLTTGFAFALGVLFPVFMETFNESRERTGKLKYLRTCFVGSQRFVICLPPLTDGGVISFVRERFERL